MSAPAGEGPAPKPKHPAQLNHEQLRKKAHAAAKRLRAHPPAEPFAPEALAWLADLITTLANRLPYPRVQTAKRGRR